MPKKVLTYSLFSRMTIATPQLMEFFLSTDPKIWCLTTTHLTLFTTGSMTTKQNSERYVSPPNWCEQAAHLLAWVWGQLEHRHAAWESGAGSPGRTAGSGSPCSGHSGPWSATQTAACDRQCYALRFRFLTSVQDSGIYAFGKASMHSHVSLTLPLKQC